MSGDRIAVLSDVHGNLTAFEAVLDDARRDGIETVVSLGDVVGKGPRGSACVALTRQRCAVTVRGNWDEWLGGEPLRVREEDGGIASAVRWWHGELTADDRAWLRGLPFAATLRLGGVRVRLVHASTTGVWDRVRRQELPARAAEFFGPSPRIEPGPAPAVVCYGDLHRAFEVRTAEGLLVNVGSVGNPLDEPRAAYAVLEAGPDGVAARLRRVDYDVEAELAAGRHLGMSLAPEWSRELREAYYRGRTD